jgi:hypothetical protein
MMAGGFNQPRDASPEDQDVLNEVVGQLRESHGLNHSEFRALKVTTQVVAGVNYLMKVHCDGSKIIHVKIAKPLPHTGQPPFVLALDDNAELTEDSPLNPL